MVGVTWLSIVHLKLSITAKFGMPRLPLPLVVVWSLASNCYTLHSVAAGTTIGDCSSGCEEVS